MATSEQREAFRRALQRARREHGWSQRKLSDALGLSHSTVSYWERGAGVPEPANVIELERVLELESGTLARLLGYMPVATMRNEMISVLDAIMADSELDVRQRELLATMYRELVRQRHAERSERKPRKGKSGTAAREQHRGE